MRVQPDDPGGLPADHMGLAVNAVAAQGTAEAPADRLILAPRPVDLADEDQPPKPEGEIVAAAETEKTGRVGAVVDRLISGVLSGGESEEEATVVQAAVRVDKPADVVAAEDLNVTGPGPASSLRPKLRPAHKVGQIPAAIQVAAKPVQDVDPASLPAGTRLAQLGAFDSPELAKQAWDQLAVKFGDYMEDKSRVVQKASSGGKNFYRLRASGFEDLADARRFCSALVAEKADCIPVATR